ncbi:MAG: nucleotidyltransferase domain-containing protein [Cyanobacteria bacterium J06592_8]
MNQNTRSELQRFKTLAEELPRQIPYLKMLILFGSRARGDTHAKSDWDFAALFDNELREACVKERAFGWWEVPNLIGEIFDINSDKIDVVDLNRCSTLIAHFIARDGLLIYEEKLGDFENFKKQATMSNEDLKEIEKSLRQQVENFLQEWGVK